MRKPFIKYALVVVTAFVLAAVLNIVFLKNFSVYGATEDPDIVWAVILHPFNFVVLSLIGCLLHWYYIGRKQVRVLSGQASRSLGIVATSAMIGFIAGTVGFLWVIFEAVKNEPLLGLFIFVLPGISLVSAVAGGAIGFAIALFRKRKQFIKRVS